MPGTLIPAVGSQKWKKLRQRVIARDRGQCVLCGSTDRLQVDHVIERQHGGREDIHNLQTLCTPCHQRKSAANHPARGKTKGPVRLKTRIRDMDRDWEPKTCPWCGCTFHPRREAKGEYCSHQCVMASRHTQTSWTAHWESECCMCGAPITATSSGTGDGANPQQPYRQTCDQHCSDRRRDMNAAITARDKYRTAKGIPLDSPSMYPRGLPQTQWRMIDVEVTSPDHSCRHGELWSPWKDDPTPVQVKETIKPRNRKRGNAFMKYADSPCPTVEDSFPVSNGAITLCGDEPPGSPRFFPDAHPSAVGSRGGEVESYARESLNQPLLPWQAQVVHRLLEIDAEGRWCRPVALICVPRQSGKSTLVRVLCEWLASQCDQMVLSASAKLANVTHLMRPTQLRGRQTPGFHVLFSKDQPECNWPGWDEDHRRWIGQAANSMLGRGFTADTVVVDECQDVPPEALEAVAPSLTEVENPLVVLTGTAPRIDSEALWSQQRKLALESGSVALFEWSAPPGSDWRDEEVWRAASPRWTSARLRHIRREAASQPEHYIRSEYLCQPVAAGADEPWIDLAAWGSSRGGLVVPSQVQVVAVEDARNGAGGCVALGWLVDGRVCVVGIGTETLDEAWALSLRAERVLCGITLRNEQSARSVSAKPVGRRETASALPELRRLLTTGLLVWDGDDLDAQLRGAVVREDAASQLSVSGSTPTGVLRCAAWVVQSVRLEREPVLV